MATQVRHRRCHVPLPNLLALLNQLSRFTWPNSLNLCTQLSQYSTFPLLNHNWYTALNPLVRRIQ